MSKMSCATKPPPVGSALWNIALSYGSYSEEESSSTSDESDYDQSATVQLAKITAADCQTQTKDDSDDVADTSVEDDAPYLSKYTVTLPPEPTGRCSQALQDKVIEILEKQQKFGITLHAIKRRKDFRNPSIYDKMVKFMGLNEYGTNYIKENSDEWAEEAGDRLCY